MSYYECQTCFYKTSKPERTNTTLNTKCKFLNEFEFKVEERIIHNDFSDTVMTDSNLKVICNVTENNEIMPLLESNSFLLPAAKENNKEIICDNIPECISSKEAKSSKDSQVPFEKENDIYNNNLTDKNFQISTQKLNYADLTTAEHVAMTSSRSDTSISLKDNAPSDRIKNFTPNAKSSPGISSTKKLDQKLETSSLKSSKKKFDLLTNKISNQDNNISLNLNANKTSADQKTSIAKTSALYNKIDQSTDNNVRFYYI